MTASKSTGVCADCGSDVIVGKGVWVCEDCGAEHEVRESHDGVVSVLDVISDEGSRAILRSLGDDMTPQDISEDCGIPLSTVYRKLELMAEVSLVTQDVRMEKGKTGGHPETFDTDFESITVELTDEGELRLRVSRGTDGD
jgi:DNA-binding transcriptional ArsR family regulator